MIDRKRGEQNDKIGRERERDRQRDRRTDRQTISERERGSREKKSNKVEENKEPW